MLFFWKVCKFIGLLNFFVTCPIDWVKFQILNLFLLKLILFFLPLAIDCFYVVLTLNQIDNTKSLEVQIFIDFAINSIHLQLVFLYLPLYLFINFNPFLSIFFKLLFYDFINFKIVPQALRFFYFLNLNFWSRFISFNLIERLLILIFFSMTIIEDVKVGSFFAVLPFLFDFFDGIIVLIFLYTCQTDVSVYQQSNHMENICIECEHFEVDPLPDCSHLQRIALLLLHLLIRFFKHGPGLENKVLVNWDR